MTQRYETILVERRGRVGIVRLNRPDDLNALSMQMMHEVVEAVERFDVDDAVRVTIITGSERVFAAGADLKEMATLSYADAFGMDLHGAWSRLALIRKPTVAAVAGFALGGGCELAMLCDLIIAADDARFGQPEIRFGTVPGMGGSARLTWAIGKSKAMDLVLTGRHIDAAEAERSGLVARVVPGATLMDAALEVANEIAAKSLPALMLAKESVNRTFESPLQEALRSERRAFHATFALADRVEGMTAFTEKRRPKFANR